MCVGAVKSHLQLHSRHNYLVQCLAVHKAQGLRNSLCTSEPAALHFGLHCTHHHTIPGGSIDLVFTWLAPEACAVTNHGGFGKISSENSASSSKVLSNIILRVFFLFIMDSQKKLLINLFFYFNRKMQFLQIIFPRKLFFLSGKKIWSDQPE